MLVFSARQRRRENMIFTATLLVDNAVAVRNTTLDPDTTSTLLIAQDYAENVLHTGLRERGIRTLVSMSSAIEADEGRSIVSVAFEADSSVPEMDGLIESVSLEYGRTVKKLTLTGF